MLFEKFIEKYEAELCKRLGISRQTLWSWKNKKSYPHRGLVDKIKQEFEIETIIIEL